MAFLLLLSIFASQPISTIVVCRFFRHPLSTSRIFFLLFFGETWRRRSSVRISWCFCQFLKIAREVKTRKISCSLPISFFFSPCVKKFQLLVGFCLSSGFRVCFCFGWRRRGDDKNEENARTEEFLVNSLPNRTERTRICDDEIQRRQERSD